MIEGDGGKATFVQVNFADESSVQAMVEKAMESFRIAATPRHDVPQEAFLQVMGVDVTGTFLSMKSATPVMLETFVRPPGLAISGIDDLGVLVEMPHDELWAWIDAIYIPYESTIQYPRRPQVRGNA